MQAPTELAQQLECLRRDGAVVIPSVYPAPLLAQVREHYLAAWGELEAQLPSLLWRRRRYHSRKRMHFLYNALYSNKLVASAADSTCSTSAAGGTTGTTSQEQRCLH